MKPTLHVFAAVMAAAACCAYAQDEDFADNADDASAAETAEPSAGDEDSAEQAEEQTEEQEGGAATVGKSSRRKIVFHLLPLCKRVDGTAEFLCPGAKTWKPLEESRHYPLGCVFRTMDDSSRVKIELGPHCEILVGGSSSLGTRVQKVGEKDRALNLIGGTVTVKAPATLPDGLLSINTPDFSICNLKGVSRYKYSVGVDGDETTVRCITQTLSVEGRHFDIPAMKAANEVRIVNSKDRLVTALYGVSGDIGVKLDQGRVFVKDYSTGEMKEEDKFLDWKLSPLTTVRIHREQPALGEKLAVTTMTFDTNGHLKNRCVFIEREPRINSGELGPTVKLTKEELSKGTSGLVDLSAKAEDAVTQEAEEPDSGEESSGETSGAADEDPAADMEF